MSKLEHVARIACFTVCLGLSGCASPVVLRMGTGALQLPRGWVIEPSAPGSHGVAILEREGGRALAGFSFADADGVEERAQGCQCKPEVVVHEGVVASLFKLRSPPTGLFAIWGQLEADSDVGGGRFIFRLWAIDLQEVQADALVAAAPR